MERRRSLWIGLSIAAGVLLGRAAMLSNLQLLIVAGLSVLVGFGILSFVRPLLAVQILVFLFVTGLSNQGSAVALRTSYTVGHLLLATLFAAWLISGRGVRSLRTRRFGGWIFWLVGLWVIFTLYGVAQGHPWSLIQRDTLPGMFLLAFFPIVDVLRDEAAVRAVLRAVAAGLVVLSLGLVYEFLFHYDAPAGNFLTTWGKVYPTEGPAGGPKIIPSAGQWVPAGLLAGFLLMQRSTSRRGGMPALMFAGLMGVAVLLMYTRSMMALTVFSIVLMGLVLARQPKRAVSTAAAVIGVSTVLAVAVPLLGGGSPGEVFEGLRTRYSNLSEDPSWVFRRQESAAGFEVFGDSPFIGEGFGVIVSIPELEDDGRPPSNAFQNAYAGLLAKTGIAGTGLFVAFLLSLIVRGIRRGLAGGGGMPRFALVGGGCWLVGMALASYSSDYLQLVSGMVYLALFAALVSAMEAVDTEAEAVRAAIMPTGVPALAGTAVSPIRSG